MVDWLIRLIVRWVRRHDNNKYGDRHTYEGWKRRQKGERP